MSGTVHVETISPAVMLLEIDNPPMNPLGVEMRQTFMEALDQVETHDALRCLIVTGRGRSFCAGDDLKSVGPQGEDLAGFGRLLDRLEATRVPVIAAVNGWCVGGGFELALCCDIRIASTEAKFVCAGVNVGLMASTYRLPRLIGRRGTALSSGSGTTTRPVGRGVYGDGAEGRGAGRNEDAGEGAGAACGGAAWPKKE